MRKNPCYTLEILQGVPYLLPVGQAVADRRRGMRLDDTGCFLWEALDRAADREALLEELARHGEVPEEEISRAREDLAEFLGILTAHGILEEEERPSPVQGQEPPFATLGIGGLRIALRGEERFFSPELLAFALADPPGETDQILTVTPWPGPVPVGARVVLRSRDLTVLEGPESWILEYPQCPGLIRGEIRRDGTLARFSVTPGACPPETLRFDLFHAMRLAFLVLAQQRGIFALHSASILYRDRAWLFSGPSGTGKSTQAALWQDAYGTPLLNGDLNLLSLRDGSGREHPGKVFVHGLPWCGTSGVATPGCWELGGIVLLRQAPENRLESLSPDRRQLLVHNRLISPTWTAEMVGRDLAFTGELSRRAPVWRYHCTKESAAAAVMRAEIDRALEEEKP